MRMLEVLGNECVLQRWPTGGGVWGQTYVAVRKADNQTVFGCIVLVLRLRNQPLARIVVGLSLSPSAVLGLVSREVGAGLDELGERLQKKVGIVRTKVVAGDLIGIPS